MARKKPIGPASQRYPNVRKEFKAWLDGLVRIYFETDPSLGEKSEFRKLERARQAIELWWYLYRYLMVWAQSQIVGYEWAKENPDVLREVANAVGVDEVTEDSHLLEYIGLVHIYNQVNDSDPILNVVSDVLEKSERWSLDNATLRRVVRELLVSRSTESSFWRFPVQWGLYALNLGEAIDPFIPAPLKRQGSPATIIRWRTLALVHVYYRKGQGLKKYVALQQVADALGQSVETLRDWEKLLRADEDRAMDLYEAEVAGRWKTELETEGVWRKWYMDGFLDERHRNTPLRERARWQHEQVARYPLEAVREGLAEGRRGSKKSGVRSVTSGTKKKGRKRTEKIPRNFV